MGFPRHALVRLFGQSAPLVFAWSIAGCDGGAVADDPCPDESATYGGRATDEACRAMLDAGDDVQVGHPSSATFLGVTGTGATLSFGWSSPIDEDGDLFRAHATSAAGTRPRLGARGRRDLALSRLLAALDPIPKALAHEAPVTGAVHMLRVTGVDGRGELLFFTTELHWFLSAEDDADVRATGGEMTIRITSAYLTQNRILNPTTDGPFRSADDGIFTVEE